MGRFDQIVFHPTDPDILFSGAPYGGIFKTTDAGDSWFPLSGYLPSLGVGGLVVHPSNPSILYVLSGNSNETIAEFRVCPSNGVYKSVDGGSTFKRTGLFPGLENSRFSARDLIMDPNDPSTLFAATDSGLFRTTNSAASWTTLITNEVIKDVAFKPGSGNVIYAIRGDDFIKSTDGGNSWTTKPVSFDLEFASRVSIAVTADDPDRVMLLAGRSIFQEDDQFYGVFRSTDAGESFELVYGPEDGPSLFDNYMDQDVTAGQVDFNNTIVIHPQDKDIVLVGGVSVWKSEDGGYNWEQETAYWAGSEAWGAEHIHPDVHQLTYNHDGKLYAATDGGVYVSDDDGELWDFLEYGMTTLMFYHFEVENDEGDTWGGTQDNGIQEEDTGEGYYKYWGGDGFDVMTDHPWRAADGESDDIYYTVNTSIRGDNTDISVEGNEDFFGNLAMDPVEEDIIYVGYVTGLYRSENAGEEWSLHSSHAADWEVTVSKSDRNQIYIAGDADGEPIRVTRIDGDQEFSLLGALHNAGYVDHRITSIVVHPSNADKIYIASSGFSAGSKVFTSDNGGDDFTNISFNLPNVPVFSLLRDHTGGLYAGTSAGVYYKQAGKDYWEPFYNKLPNVPVTGMELYNPVNGIPQSIMICTYGRGLFTSPVYDANCPATLSLIGEIGWKYHRDADQIIQSIQIIRGTEGAEVIYNTGEEVRLLPGFHARNSSLFRAVVAGCGEEVD